MQETTRHKVGRHVAMASGFVFSISWETPANAQQARQSQQDIDRSAYVGSETCKTCHEDLPSKGFYIAALFPRPHLLLRDARKAE